MALHVNLQLAERPQNLEQLLEILQARDMESGTEMTTAKMKRAMITMNDDANEHQSVKCQLCEKTIHSREDSLAAFENTIPENILSRSGLDVLRSPRRLFLA